MAQGVNRYRADLREFEFLLFEQFHLEELLGRAPFGQWGVDEVRQTLKGAYRFATEVYGPLNASGDREGCRVEGGQVYTPEGFKGAWTALYEQGWRLVGTDPEHGGQGGPRVIAALVEELLSGANAAFNMYPGLTYGAAELLDQCGTPEQKARFLPNMFHGVWGGTMCLTEPQAGSDVGSARTRAVKNPDGSYAITGTKIFISAGDHDLAENIIHMVLARVEGAPPGTKGLSLFVVPKRKLSEDGASGENNDVQLGSIEHKMGINGSSTCVLNFGENGGATGYLVGEVENRGMSQMFLMMNFARIGVALQGVALASAAYLSALEYARDRRQGANIARWKDPTAPRVPILEHADVRRMLLDMKARVEGVRALVCKLALHDDRARALAGRDDERSAYHKGQVELLTPIAKAYASDQAFRVCETAIQTFGGAGYVKDHPVEQYCRDSKIFSIYEGTNHIQSMDLVGRKLGQNGGAHTQQFLGDVGAFVAEHREHPALGAEVRALGAAQEALSGTTLKLLEWFQGGQLALVPLSSTRFLEMMAEVAVAWLLLDGARLADKALGALAEDHPERAFYQGKLHAARYFARNVLPGVELKARILAEGDTSALDIPDAAFATV
ncbi:MAG: acyl-CoA dehydrogenase [Deltaproteobacteria bacterium]|nr:acyl-CoA dehydrogenase [Deltaproteobacteria bacterium]